MKKLLLLLTIFTLTSIHAQSFKKGKITLENGEVINADILYNIPLNTPQNFTYRLTTDGENQTVNKSEIKSVEITDITNFIKKDVQINRNKVGNDGFDIGPNFNLVDETLILEILVKGSQTLYKFTEANLSNFFYESEENGIKPLLYKEYIDTDKASVKIKKTDFRKDLNTIACIDTNVNYINYRESELVKFFKKNNECKGDTNQIVKRKQSKSNLKLLASYDFIKKDLQNYSDKAYSFGVEYEFFIPFLNNNFSTTLSAIYTNINTDKEQTKIGINNMESMISIPFSFRYYIINKEKIKFYTSITPLSFSISKGYTRTLLANNPIKNVNLSYMNIFDNIEVGFRYSDFEVFGKFYTTSKETKNKQSASIGVKYNLPFIK